MLAAALLAAVALAGFAVAERRHPDPLVRGDLLRLRSLRKGGALILLLGLWNGGEMLVLSLYFQQVLHDSPLVTGLAIAPQGVVGFAAGAFGARLAARLGLHRLLVLTNAVAMLGFLVLTRLPATGGYSPLLAAVTLVGFGTAGTAFGSMVTATKGVAYADQGRRRGDQHRRQIGAGIGAALLPAIALTVSHGGPTAGVSGDRAAMLTGAAAAALATVIAVTAIRATGGPARATRVARWTGGPAPQRSPRTGGLDEFSAAGPPRTAPGDGAGHRDDGPRHGAQPATGRIHRRCVEPDPEPAAQLAADGATAHDDPAQAVEHADVVITMVPDAPGGQRCRVRPGHAGRATAGCGVGPRWARSASRPPTT